MFNYGGDNARKKQLLFLTLMLVAKTSANLVSNLPVKPGRLLTHSNGCPHALPCLTNTGYCLPYECGDYCSQTQCAPPPPPTLPPFSTPTPSPPPPPSPNPPPPPPPTTNPPPSPTPPPPPTPTPSPPPPPSPKPPPPPPPSSYSAGSPEFHLCDIVRPILAGTPQCSCTETTGRTGLVTECLESIGVLGTVGVRLQLEPCGDPASMDITYQFGGTRWNSAGNITANGKPLRFSIPGASLLGAGLFISVTMSGNGADLSVHAHLSACIFDTCDGDVPLPLGAVLVAAGFPFSLLAMDDLGFVDSCPVAEGTKVIMMAAYAGVLAALVGMIIAICFYRRKKERARGAGPVVILAQVVPPILAQPVVLSAELQLNKV
jgi:hypothetical protein